MRRRPLRNDEDLETLAAQCHALDDLPLLAWKPVVAAPCRLWRDKHCGRVGMLRSKRMATDIRVTNAIRLKLTAAGPIW